MSDPDHSDPLDDSPDAPTGDTATQPSVPTAEWIDSQVPPGADTADCPYCGRPFARERHRDLHRGQAHPDRLTDREVAAYREAAETEWADLRRFRLLALGALVALYFGFLLAFAVFA